MQLFILLYIEGGSYINEDEDTWEFVVLCVTTFVAPSLNLTCALDMRSERDETTQA